MKRLIAAVADKGGVGKTRVARALTDLFRLSGRRIAAFDLDAQNASFAAYDPARISICYAADSAAWLDAAYDAAIDDVIVDVPGGHVADFAERVAASPAALVEALREADRNAVIVVPIGVESDETMHALTALETWSDTGAHVVLVLNGRDGDLSDHIVFQDDVADRADAAGASTLWMPRIPARLRATLSRHGMTMHDARDAANVVGREAALNARFYLADLARQWAGTWLDARGEGDGSVRIALPTLTARIPAQVATR